MHIIEQNDTLVLRNGEGSPRRQIVLQAIFVIPIASGVVLSHLSAAMRGWVWGWLALLIVPPAIYGFVRSWRELCHATLEIDRRFGRVRIERRYATRVVEEKLRLSDIAGLEIETTKDSDGDKTFGPVLALRDGRRIMLGPKRSDMAPLERAVAAVRGLV
ncbi:MAG: hypothetical protein AB7O57_15475 [Hyphomicrobiaceae bacterium]